MNKKTWIREQGIIEHIASGKRYPIDEETDYNILIRNGIKYQLIPKDFVKDGVIYHGDCE